MVLEIKTVEEFKKIIKYNPLDEIRTAPNQFELVIIDFFTDWCGPCKRIAPFYASLEKKYPNIKLYKINSDTAELSDIVAACDVTSLPTFCFFVNSIYKTKITGANEAALENLIVKFLAMSLVPSEPVAPTEPVENN